MKSDEQRIGEAVASLTTRLTSWGVDDGATKAHEYVHDMLRNGWRPRAPEVWSPPMPDHRADPAPYAAAAREAMRANRLHPEETP